MGKFSDDKFKAPARVLQDRIDDLINWYEQNRPQAGRRIEVDCFEQDLKFCTEADGHHWYRGRELVPTKKRVVSAKKHLEASQSRI